jgi:hypothetical protein
MHNIWGVDYDNDVCCIYDMPANSEVSSLIVVFSRLMCSKDAKLCRLNLVLGFSLYGNSWMTDCILKNYHRKPLGIELSELLLHCNGSPY